jgi:hypothetical protein
VPSVNPSLAVSVPLCVRLRLLLPSTAATIATIAAEGRNSEHSFKCPSYCRVSHILLPFGPRPFVLILLVLLFSRANPTQHLIHTDETGPRTTKNIRLVAVQTSSILAVSGFLSIGYLLQLRALVKAQIASVADQTFPLAGPVPGILISVTVAVNERLGWTCRRSRHHHRGRNAAQHRHCLSEVSNGNLYLSRLRTTERA